ncbi:SDR family oxidoreductase [Mucilaginibacter jinjuensis]|uniref:SDR family oxidoreductase n=1 Tax=Mucilaginibacter jinjuensis TaxID=1176721 RepID=A0ABY7T0P4_9SPHI|nr:SDR family oxidoreductase [Mucilaginibacter jinjuensis]WCT10007.1 SDR family oxidoreductase [Mucilaginibacter jinjuensis]
MTVSILGCGWFGFALAKSLLQEGVAVKGSTTSKSKLSELVDVGIIPFLIQIDQNAGESNPDFFDCDLLVVCIPPQIKAEEGELFLQKINNIISAINQYQISKVIYISTTGVYGDLGIEVNENSDPQPDTENGKLLLQAELIFQSQPNFKTTIVRFGGLVGPGRHPGRFFAGKKDIANGKAPVNLIHQVDAVGVVMAIVKGQYFGQVFNGCSPDHPSRSDFYTGAARQGGFEIPEFKDELKGWKIVSSTKVSELLDYEFKVKDWLNCQF